MVRCSILRLPGGREGRQCIIYNVGMYNEAVLRIWAAYIF